MTFVDEVIEALKAAVAEAEAKREEEALRREMERYALDQQATDSEELTPGFKEIVKEAELAGMTISRAPGGSVLVIAKVDGRNGSISRGATLYPDGVAINAAADLGVACGIRRLDSVRDMLRLPRAGATR